MRSTWTALLAASLMASVSLPASATEGVLRVRCQWHSDTDLKGFATKDLAGTLELTYEPSSDLTGTMIKEGLTAVFVAATRDNLIEGVAHYVVDGATAEERIELNRNTGVILNVIRTPTSAHLLRGTCVRLSGPDFGKDTNGG